MNKTKKVHALGFKTLHLNSDYVLKSIDLIEQDNKKNSRLDYKNVQDLVNTFLKSFIDNPLPKYSLITSQNSLHDLREEHIVLSNQVSSLMNQMEMMIGKMKNMEKNL